MRDLLRVYGLELYGADVWHPAEEEAQMIREKICKIESFLLRALKLHLEMPPSEARVMLEIYVERFRKIFMEKEFTRVE